MSISEQELAVMATNLGAEELRKHLGDRITRRLFDMADPVVMR